jgi:hypothetical protein
MSSLAGEARCSILLENVDRLGGGMSSARPLYKILLLQDLNLCFLYVWWSSQLVVGVVIVIVSTGTSIVMATGTSSCPPSALCLVFTSFSSWEKRWHLMGSTTKVPSVIPEIKLFIWDMMCWARMGVSLYAWGSINFQALMVCRYSSKFAILT